MIQLPSICRTPRKCRSSTHYFRLYIMHRGSPMQNFDKMAIFSTLPVLSLTAGSFLGNNDYLWMNHLLLLFAAHLCPLLGCMKCRFFLFCQSSPELSPAQLSSFSSLFVLPLSSNGFTNSAATPFARILTYLYHVSLGHFFPLLL